MSSYSILLTNDDGIDGPGLQALYDGLAHLGDLTVVAPTVNHSGLGRVLSYGRPVPVDVGETTAEMQIEGPEFTYELPYTRRELGYAVAGTPCDCVIAGIHAFDTSPDIVVSGCNAGPNVGVSAFGRSGTVSAAMEAAYLGVPAMAVSSSRPADEEAEYDFENAVELTADLVSYALERDVFETVDYLNIVAPSGDMAGTEITRPDAVYEMDARPGDGVVEIVHTTMKRSFEPAGVAAPGTDRDAIRRDRASITPLSLPHTHENPDELVTFADRFDG